MISLTRRGWMAWAGAAALAGAAGAARAGPGEAAARKARSIAILRREGVPVLESLPMIETEATSLRRGADEVVRRAIALANVAVKGETGNHALGQSLIAQYGAAGFFSPAERAFMADKTPPRQSLTDFTWRYEGAQVMLWALGIFDDLGRPDAICDAARLGSTLNELGTKGLRRIAILRPQSALLDAADLAYRYHWAVVDARIHDRAAPAGLVPGVSYERLYALNWLIGYGRKWDEISTDT